MITRKTVAHADSGVGVDEITLSDGATRVSFLTIGATTRDWRIVHDDAEISVVLGHENPLTYIDNPYYFGAIAGRVANRVAGGRFEFEGQLYQCSQNEGQNMLHGGHVGLAKRHFVAEIDESQNSVTFKYHSPDGEEGFPATVDFTYVITLNGSAVTYELFGAPDRPTPINLAQHNYYNLMGHGDIRGHRLSIGASHFTQTDNKNIPTGEILSVADTRYDFRNGGLISDVDADCLGMDMNLVFDADKDPRVTACAQNGLNLSMKTTQPGIQLYTGHYLAKHVGNNGQQLGPFSGFCLEPQHFPDSLNHAGFETCVATPDKPYYQKLTVDIGKASS